jgi:RNase P/RNase MRP subunit p29
MRATWLLLAFGCGSSPLDLTVPSRPAARPSPPLSEQCDGVLRRHRLGGQPKEIAASSEAAGRVVAETKDALVVLDDGHPRDVFLPSTVQTVAMRQDGTAFAVTVRGSLHRLDPGATRVSASAAIPGRWLTLEATDDAVWLSDDVGTLVEVDGSSLTERRRLQLPHPVLDLHGNGGDLAVAMTGTAPVLVSDTEVRPSSFETPMARVTWSSGWWGMTAAGDLVTPSGRRHPTGFGPRALYPDADGVWVVLDGVETENIHLFGEEGRRCAQTGRLAGVAVAATDRHVWVARTVFGIGHAQREVGGCPTYRDKLDARAVEHRGWLAGLAVTPSGWVVGSRRQNPKPGELTVFSRSGDALRRVPVPAVPFRHEVVGDDVVVANHRPDGDAVWRAVGLATAATPDTTTLVGDPDAPAVVDIAAHPEHGHAVLTKDGAILHGWRGHETWRVDPWVKRPFSLEVAELDGTPTEVVVSWGSGVITWRTGDGQRHWDHLPVQILGDTPPLLHADGSTVWVPGRREGLFAYDLGTRTYIRHDVPEAIGVTAWGHDIAVAAGHDGLVLLRDGAILARCEGIGDIRIVKADGDTILGMTYATLAVWTPPE